MQGIFFKSLSHMLRRFSQYLICYVDSGMNNFYHVCDMRIHKKMGSGDCY